MIGAICGDILASRYAQGVQPGETVHLMDPADTFTDSTVLSMAIASWRMDSAGKPVPQEQIEADLVRYLKEFTLAYPDKSYGTRYMTWLSEHADNDPLVGNDSLGVGAAMRAVPMGWSYYTLEEAQDFALLQAMSTHNTPEAIRGAQAIASATFQGRNMRPKAEIRRYSEITYKYDLSMTMEQARETYRADSSAENTVPSALICFLQSESYEQAILNAISMGEYCDTIACMAGGVAEAFYGKVPAEIREHCLSKLDDRLREVYARFRKMFL